METLTEKRILFRVIDPQFGPDNIYRFQAKNTVSLGPVMIATIASKSLVNLDAEVITENNYRQSRKGPRDKNGPPDHLALQQERYAEIVGISGSISNAVPRALALIRIYKDMPPKLRPKAIIVGGWHAGDLPKDFLEAGADVIVHGEAELIIASLVEALVNGFDLDSISGISYWSDGQIRRNPIFNSRYEGEPGHLIVPQEEMDLLPFPDFGLVRFAKIKYIPIFRVRGCKGRCRFCRVKAKPRWLSPQRFVGQIKNAYSLGWRDFFCIDDRSEENMAGFLESLNLLIQWRKERKIRRLHVMAQDRLSLGKYPEILKLMYQAGIDCVAIGFESPIPEELGAMRKPLDPRKMAEWAKAYQKAGILVHAMWFLGYPIPFGKPQPLNRKGQPMSAKERAKVFWPAVKRFGDTCQVLAFTPIPGTEDWDDLESQGRILHELGWENWDGLHVVFQPDAGMTPQEIQHQLELLQMKFYAFRFLWPLGWLTIGLHWIRIIIAHLSMPFTWAILLPFKGWQPALAWRWPARVRRNAWRHFQANLIILAVRGKLAAYTKKLEAVLRRRQTKQL